MKIFQNKIILEIERFIFLVLTEVIGDLAKKFILSMYGELYEICQGSYLTQENSKLPSPPHALKVLFLEKSRAL